MNWRNKWILNEQGEPVLVKDAMVWARWFEEYRQQRIVKQEWIGNVRVSTVFLGLDRRWGKGPPILWETTCFSNRKEWNQETDRCAGGREQAEAMHERMVERVKKGQNEQRNKS